MGIMNFLFPVLFILFWSSGAIFANLGLKYADPFSLLLIRGSLSTFLIFIIYLFSTAKKKFLLSSKELIKIFVIALLLQCGYQSFFSLSLVQQVSPGLMVIILSAQPILTALLMQRRLTEMQVMGLVLGLIGLVLVIYNYFYIGNIHYLGIGYGILALLFMTIGSFLQKKYCREIPLTVNLLTQYLFSTLVYFIIWSLQPHTFLHWGVALLVSWIWLSLVISVLASYLLYYLINQGNLFQVSNYFYCVPIVTAILDYFIFHNIISIMTFIGMIFILSGQYFVNLSENKRNVQSATLSES